MVFVDEPVVYIAARQEDQLFAWTLRRLLEHEAVSCCASWLDLEDLSGISADAAERCLREIDAASALVLLSHRETFRNTTGGNVETGYAIARGKPVIVVGEAQNVFHGLRKVRVVPAHVTVSRLARAIRESTRSVNDDGQAITLEARRD